MAPTVTITFSAAAGGNRLYPRRVLEPSVVMKIARDERPYFDLLLEKVLVQLRDASLFFFVFVGDIAVLYVLFPVRLRDTKDHLVPLVHISYHGLEVL